METLDIDRVLDELYSYSKFGIKLGLENIKSILEILGNPQDAYKVIHIAGTNGKGSTASMIEASLIEAGYSVGKYTSPHIMRFNERIVLNKKEISDSEIVYYFKQVKEALAKGKLMPTFFEVTTAMMFLYFKDKKIEYLVLEVGLGGKYDATNVVNPIASIITSISKDHTNFLGDTLYEIACEKAGIIKNAPVFISPNAAEVLKAIEEVTKEYTISTDKYKHKIYLENNYTVVEIEKTKFEISLYGLFQGDNFLTAYSVLKYIGIEDDVIKKAVKRIYWPGRFEISKISNQEIIFDGAHNKDSALKLKENILRKYKKEDIILIASILEDKNILDIIDIFSDFSNQIIYTNLTDFARGCTAKHLFELDVISKNKSYEEDIKLAFERAKTKDKVIVVAGSFYLISKFKREILN